MSNDLDAEPGASLEIDRIYGMFGGSINRSPSPRIHNGAYRAYGLSARYVAIPTANAAMPAMLRETLADDRVGGLTVVSPHKELAVALADELDDTARRCGAANLLVRGASGWRAETTDAWGVLEPLRRRGLSPAGRRALVIGCGGAGRAAAVALADAGAEVTLVNRNVRRGELARELLGLPWISFDRLGARGWFDARDWELVVNATPLGQDGELPPFAPSELPPGAIVIDFVYANQATPLIALARAAGHTVIDGREILVVQVAAQFRRMTGIRLDEPLAWQLAGWAEPSASATTEQRIA